MPKKYNFNYLLLHGLYIDKIERYGAKFISCPMNIDNVYCTIMYTIKVSDFISKSSWGFRMLHLHFMLLIIFVQSNWKQQRLSPAFIHPKSLGISKVRVQCTFYTGCLCIWIKIEAIWKSYLSCYSIWVKNNIQQCSRDWKKTRLIGNTTRQRSCPSGILAATSNDNTANYGRSPVNRMSFIFCTLWIRISWTFKAQLY